MLFGLSETSDASESTLLDTKVSDEYSELIVYGVIDLSRSGTLFVSAFRDLRVFRKTINPRIKDNAAKIDRMTITATIGGDIVVPTSAALPEVALDVGPAELGMGIAPATVDIESGPREIDGSDFVLEGTSVEIGRIPTDAMEVGMLPDERGEPELLDNRDVGTPCVSVVE